MIRHPAYLVIGNPENRRVALFQAALKRCERPPARVLSYHGILNDPDSLTDELAEWRRRASASDTLCVRLESPGENAEVERLLTMRGLKLTGRRARFAMEHGRIQLPQFWFAGYSDLLNQVALRAQEFEGVCFASHPDDILLAFNKPQCHQHLVQHGIATPEALSEVSGYEQLIHAMRERNWNRVFVKLATGSSASGVVALQLHASGPRAITSMEMVGGGQRAKFYNNLRLHVYSRAGQIATIINFLCKSGAHIERWLPKAAIVDRNFDLRLLTIGARPMHCVVRTSRSPITNLHLGNRRGDLQLLRERMSASAWSAVLELAGRTAAVFARSHMLGLDILLQPGFRRPVVLEVNAFGDLLPGVLYRNLDSYAAQIETWGDRDNDD